MIPALIHEVLRDLQALAERHDLQILLLGAHAVDHWAQDGQRQTNDADFAVAIASWEALDAFLNDAVATTFRDLRRDDLRLHHRATRVPIDVIPCGGIEAPPGTLDLRRSDRRFNNAGIAESFDGATPALPDTARVRIPEHVALIALKLIAWSDRRQVKDIVDLGRLLRALPPPGADLFDDPAFLAALEVGTAVYEDWAWWRVGLDLRRRFAPATLDALQSAVTTLRQAATWTRAALVPAAALAGQDGRLEQADRILVGLTATLYRPLEP